MSIITAMPSTVLATSKVLTSEDSRGPQAGSWARNCRTVALSAGDVNLSTDSFSDPGLNPDQPTWRASRRGYVRATGLSSVRADPLFVPVLEVRWRIRLRHMHKADPRELMARADGPKDSVRTQDSAPAVVAVASVRG